MTADDSFWFDRKQAIAQSDLKNSIFRMFLLPLMPLQCNCSAHTDTVQDIVGALGCPKKNALISLYADIRHYCVGRCVLLPQGKTECLLCFWYFFLSLFNRCK